MLELRPSCEHCNTALPPDFTGSSHLLLRMHVLRKMRG